MQHPSMSGVVSRSYEETTRGIGFQVGSDTIDDDDDDVVLIGFNVVRSSHRYPGWPPGSALDCDPPTRGV